MSVFPYELAQDSRPHLGLVVLQSDETIEDDLRRLLPPSARLMVSRVPSGLDVTTETLGAMEGHLAAATGLFPRGLDFDVIGYGCTSGSAQIGPEQVAARVREGAPAAHVTNPLSALVAACRAASVTRLALLSPYVESVSARLRDALAEEGISTPVFGSFDEASEARVVRIDGRSIAAAAEALVECGGVDALFLSCTNLRTLDVLDNIAGATSLPVWSSNLVLAWHMALLAGCVAQDSQPGDLLTH